MEDLEQKEGLDEGRPVEEKTRYDLSNYYGMIITPENRREYIESYGKEAVRVAQKAEKAWKKGKTHFTYKGERYPIMTQEYVDFMESQKEFLTQLQEFQDSELQTNEEE